MEIEEVKALMEKQAANHGEIIKILENLTKRVTNLEEFVWKAIGEQKEREKNAAKKA